MCGSTGTSTSTNTTLPTAAAQANYDKLSSLAWNTYNQPYQQYTGEMVAGLSPTEQTGIQNINAAAGLAQPYFAQATADINQGQSYALPKIDAAYNQVGLGQQLGSQYNQNATNTLNAAYSELTPQVRQQESAVNAALGQGQNYLTQATNLAGNAAAPVYAQQFSQDALSQYMNPYMNQVIQGTLAPLRQQQQMEQQGLIGNQITQGAFGGERADLARAALGSKVLAKDYLQLRKKLLWPGRILALVLKQLSNWPILASKRFHKTLARRRPKRVLQAKHLALTKQHPSNWLHWVQAHRLRHCRALKLK